MRDAKTSLLGTWPLPSGQQEAWLVLSLRFQLQCGEQVGWETLERPQTFLGKQWWWLGLGMYREQNEFSKCLWYKR